MLDRLRLNSGTTQFTFVRHETVDEGKIPVIIRRLYETGLSGRSRAITWRTPQDQPETSIKILHLKHGASLLDMLSDEKHLPVITPDMPVLLSESPLRKTWGEEITYTMIDPRQVNEVADEKGRRSKLPDVLDLFPDSFGIDPRKDLILLKILRPGPVPVENDLYLEVHWKKEEAYIVTDIDRRAWPSGKAPVVCGLDPDRMAVFVENFGGKWKKKFKRNFRAVSNLYRNFIYNGIILRGRDPLHDPDPDVPSTEEWLREKVFDFVGSRTVRRGDVLVFPKGTVHSLRHGIEVAEILTPHYERGIIVPTPHEVKSNGGEWNTDEAFKHLVMAAYSDPVFDIIPDPSGHRIEHLVRFPIAGRHFDAQRVTLCGDGPLQSTTAPSAKERSYHLLLAITGAIRVRSNKGWEVVLHPKKGMIVPASNGNYGASAVKGQNPVYLKMFLVE